TPWRGEGERRRDVQEAPACGIVEATRADIGGRAPHQLEELRVVEIRPDCPYPCCGTGDERGGEARAVGVEEVARGLLSERLGYRDAGARRREVDRPRER